MTDSANPTVEIGFSTGISYRNNLRVGFNHVAIQIGGGALALFLNGVRSGAIAYTGGVKYSTGPWTIGGNVVNAGDSSNITMSYVQISDIARSDAYLAANALAWGGGS